MNDATLCFLLRGSPPREVLLGFKKSGFGAGKYAGFGGKVEPGETIAAAAAREMEEESGVRVSTASLRHAGFLSFRFPHRPAWDQDVTVFLAEAWDGQPTESREMAPDWYPLERIPYDQMWQDTSHWLPRILAGQTVDMLFTFAADCETVHQVQDRN